MNHMQNTSENTSDLPPDMGITQQSPNSTAPISGGTGYLIVRVTTARGVIPLEGVPVRIWDYNDDTTGQREGLVGVYRTDRSGNTERISLPAPPRELSEQPGNKKPYATYNIDVQTNGYYEQFYTNVPIFDGITSVQQADLAPIAENGRTDNIPLDSRNFRESQNPDL